VKSDARIESEVLRLKEALKEKGRWNAKARETLLETINVLEHRMSPARVEREYYVDETSSEYKDDDNLLWNELDRAARWMFDEKGFNAPAAGL